MKISPSYSILILRYASLGASGSTGSEFPFNGNNLRMKQVLLCAVALHGDGYKADSICTNVFRARIWCTVLLSFTSVLSSQLSILRNFVFFLIFRTYNLNMCLLLRWSLSACKYTVQLYTFVVFSFIRVSSLSF